MTRILTGAALTASTASNVRDALLFRADLSGREAVKSPILGAKTSPSTLPIGWAVLQSLNLATTVTGVGADYVDIQISGTPNATSSYILRVGALTDKGTAAINDVWASSGYAALLSGSFTNIGNTVFSVGEYNAAGNLIDGALYTPDQKASFDGNQRRIGGTFTLTNPATSRVAGLFILRTTSGLAVNATFRFYSTEIQLRSGVIAFNSGLGTISWNQVNYLGIGTLGTISAIEESAEIQGAGVKVTLSGVPGALISSALLEDYQNRPCYIYHAFFDVNTDALILDPVLIFEGEIDTMEVAVGSSATISVSCENILARWQRPNVRRWTDIEQRRRYPDDKGFQYVSESAERQIYWGRPAPK